MGEVFVEGFGVSVSKKSERLVVKKKGKVIFERPFFEVERVIISTEGATVSAAAIHDCVKHGIPFPFITIIESPTLLDVASYLAAVKLADQHGYGKYSANHGKFATEFFAVSTGYPQFSVLDMLTWLENDKPEEAGPGDSGNESAVGTTAESKIADELTFETAVGEPMSLLGGEIAEVRAKLGDEFESYVRALDDV